MSILMHFLPSVFFHFMAADILQLTWALFATQIEDEIRHCIIKTSIFISLPCKTLVKEPNKSKLWKGKEKHPLARKEENKREQNRKGRLASHVSGGHVIRKTSSSHRAYWQLTMTKIHGPWLHKRL